MRRLVLAVAAVALLGQGTLRAEESPAFEVLFAQRGTHCRIGDDPGGAKLFQGPGTWSGADAHLESSSGSSVGTVDQDTTITVEPAAVAGSGRLELRLIDSNLNEMWNICTAAFSGADTFAWSCSLADSGAYGGGNPIADAKIYDIGNPRQFVLVADLPMNGSASVALDPTRPYQFSVYLQLYGGSTDDKSYAADFAFRASGAGSAPAALRATLSALAAEPAASFTNPGNRTALANFLEQALASLDAVRPDQAAARIRAALERCDGWSLRGAADEGGHGFEKDFVTDREAAMDAHRRLSVALAALGG